MTIDTDNLERLSKTLLDAANRERDHAVVQDIWFGDTLRQASETITAELIRLRGEVERLRDVDLIEQAINDRMSDGASIREVAQYVADCLTAPTEGSRHD